MEYARSRRRQMRAGALPLYILLFSTVYLSGWLYSPVLLYQRLQVRLDGHLCAVHDVADMQEVSV